MLVKKNIFIGTSGWIYKSWDSRFYPLNLKENRLEFYSKHFNTVELNFSFYKLPTQKMFESWFNLTPKGFKFSVKLNRYITHTKRLKIDENSRRIINFFLNNAKFLKKKLAVILIQLPSNFELNYERLEQFIKYLSKILIRKNLKIRVAVEFRNNTWFCEEIFKLMQDNNFTIVINDSSSFPMVKKYISNFLYIRLHGPSILYASKYSTKDLKKWADKINDLPDSINDIYIYFNNDFFAYAVKDAMYLKKILI